MVLISLYPHLIEMIKNTSTKGFYSNPRRKRTVEITPIGSKFLGSNVIVLHRIKPFIYSWSERN